MFILEAWRFTIADLPNPLHLISCIRHQPTKLIISTFNVNASRKLHCEMVFCWSCEKHLPEILCSLFSRADFSTRGTEKKKLNMGKFNRIIRFLNKITIQSWVRHARTTHVSMFSRVNPSRVQPTSDQTHGINDRAIFQLYYDSNIFLIVACFSCYTTRQE